MDRVAEQMRYRLDKILYQHRGVAPGQYQADGLAMLGANGAEDISRRGPLV